MTGNIDNENRLRSQLETAPSTSSDPQSALVQEPSPLATASFSAKQDTSLREPFIGTSLGTMLAQEQIIRWTHPEFNYKARTEPHYGSNSSSIIQSDVIQDLHASFKQFPKDSPERAELIESLIEGLKIDRGRGAPTRLELVTGKEKEVSDFNYDLAVVAEKSLVSLLETKMLSASEVVSFITRDDYPAMKAGFSHAIEDLFGNFTLSEPRLTETKRAVGGSLLGLMNSTESSEVRERLAHIFHEFRFLSWFDTGFEKAVSNLTQREAIKGQGDFSSEEAQRLRSIYLIGYPTRGEQLVNVALDIGAGVVNLYRNVGRGMTEISISAVNSLKGLIGRNAARAETSEANHDRAA